MKGNFFVLFVIICSFMPGCYKYERSGNMDKPGIALTFDDRSIDNWFKYLSLLDSFGAKATFYISSYHLLTIEEKNKLREIQRHGHEIAYHTTFHNNLCEYFKLHRINDLMQMEIYQDLKKMNRDGFYPRTFAYPFGSHDYYLDNQLLAIFKSVRALNGGNDLAKSVVGTTSNAILYALSMDNNRRSNNTIERMIDLANKNRNCLVMVGHQIENANAKYQVPYEKLKFILKKAKSLNMNFYLISEISY